MSRRWLIVLCLFGLVGCYAAADVVRVLAPEVQPFALVPVPRTEVGTVIHRGGGQEIDGLAALGVRHARHTFYTAEDGVTPDYRGVFKARLDYLDVKGIEPLLLVWDFTDMDHAVATMADLTRFYPNRLWQVGNEYDAKPWQSWCHTGAQYADLMRRVVAACPPSTRFVSMGLATADWHAPPIAPDASRRQTFYREYTLANGPALLAWCLHVYGLPQGRVLAEQVTEFQQALRGAAPLWLTEFGTDRGDIEHAYGPQTLAQVDAVQADTMREVVTRAPALGIARAYQYCYWSENDDGFGLVRRNDTPRPSWSTIRSLV